MCDLLLDLFRYKKEPLIDATGVEADKKAATKKGS